MYQCRAVSSLFTQFSSISSDSIISNIIREGERLYMVTLHRYDDIQFRRSFLPFLLEKAFYFDFNAETEEKIWKFALCKLLLDHKLTQSVLLRLSRSIYDNRPVRHLQENWNFCRRAGKVNLVCYSSTYSSNDDIKLRSDDDDDSVILR